MLILSLILITTKKIKQIKIITIFFFFTTNRQTNIKKQNKKTTKIKWLIYCSSEPKIGGCVVCIEHGIGLIPLHFLPEHPVLGHFKLSAISFFIATGNERICIYIFQ